MERRELLILAMKIAAFLPLAASHISLGLEPETTELPLSEVEIGHLRRTAATIYRAGEIDGSPFAAGYSGSFIEDSEGNIYLITVQHNIYRRPADPYTKVEDPVIYPETSWYNSPMTIYIPEGSGSTLQWQPKPEDFASIVSPFEGRFFDDVTYARVPENYVQEVRNSFSINPVFSGDYSDLAGQTVYYAVNDMVSSSDMGITFDFANPRFNLLSGSLTEFRTAAEYPDVQSGENITPTKPNGDAVVDLQNILAGQGYYDSYSQRYYAATCQGHSGSMFYIRGGDGRFYAIGVISSAANTHLADGTPIYPTGFDEGNVSNDSFRTCSPGAALVKTLESFLLVQPLPM